MEDLDFWQKHSLSFLEMALRVDKRERLRQADGHGLVQGSCGDTIEFFIQVRDNSICGASFETDGCLFTIACANTVVHLIEGKSVQYAQDLEPETILGFLELFRKKNYPVRKWRWRRCKWHWPIFHR